MSDTHVALEPELETLASQLDKLSLLQASKLVKALESRWGVSAAAPVAVAAAGAGAGAAAPVKEEKTSFSVILESYTAEKKINVIKDVRAITSLGLKEAKDLVDGAPKPIKEGVSKEEAEDIKKKVEEAGGKVKID
jgi:large subunit ribosomal protein L7/L12